ncbi:unnamed protein product [Parnassius mnemosyne]|uniref:Peptidoglycan recognition protein family domain-containing protein n=1 Tax=Parnassius mnemosyne TaxID=213953 RepID=A0AAV1LVW9_9NEOP
MTGGICSTLGRKLYAVSCFNLLHILFAEDEPTSKALDAAKELIKCGVQQGHLASNYHVVGHRQLIATESPGRKLYNEIRRWSDWLDDVSSIKN